MFDLAGEIAGGAMDLNGDRLRSAKSLALLKGRRFALHTSAVLFFACAGLTFLLYLLGWFRLVYLGLAAVLTVVLSVFHIQASAQFNASGRTKNIRRLYLTNMLFIIALIAILLL